METTTILYIILALLLSISVAFFQYFHKNKDTRKINVLLFFLRTLSLFLVGILLVNPTIKNTILENKKPVLAVLVDNSLSTKFFKADKKVTEIVAKIKSNKQLQNKFEVTYFTLGTSLQVLDSLTFNDAQTNIFDAITSANEVYKNENGAIVLLSDGNQTFRFDYEFLASEKAIYPMVIGDTTQYVDVKINQLNVNKYSYIKNKFPVETMLFYKGKEQVNTQFSIYHKGKTVFSKKVTFTSVDNSKTITANLSSVKEGLQYYTASIKKIANEKNTKNNRKTFSVEVINEQTKVLLLSSVLHPDLGVLKKSIESNKQRTVEIKLIDDFKGKLNKYQLIVLFNPNRSFNTVLQKIKQQNSNYFIISGVKTDWNFLNNQQLGFSKNSINQTENYEAVYNDGFLTFYQKNIGFSQFPPLKDLYGEVSISKPHQILLYQQINGINTEQPLLATAELNGQKSAILFGSGLWQWRAASFLQHNSFEEFDAFISNFIQYLASTKKRKRLSVSSKNLYPANSKITITAFYVDKNYQFDARASLWLQLTNDATKETKKIPFSLVQNSYQIELENESSGNYSFKVSVDNQQIKRYGKFKITDFKVEEQFVNANHQKLKKLADKTGGKRYFIHQEDEFIKNLLEDTSYYTTQKSTIKEESIIQWKWLLFLIIGLLSAEWFIRKYYGKI